MKNKGENRQKGRIVFSDENRYNKSGFLDLANPYSLNMHKQKKGEATKIEFIVDWYMANTEL